MFNKYKFIGSPLWMIIIFLSGLFAMSSYGFIGLSIIGLGALLNLIYDELVTIRKLLQNHSELTEILLQKKQSD